MTTLEAAAPELGAGRLRRGAALVADNRGALTGALVLTGVLAFCLLGPVVSPHDANAIDFAHGREGPSREHPLGTDQFGRDLATRLALGGRISLLIAAGALAVLLTIGVVYGTVAGLAGGRIDAVLSRVLDGLFALPRLPISIVILVVFGLSSNTIPVLIVALSILNWMLTARLVRGHVMALKTRDFVRAARSLGARWDQIARRHLVRNSAGILLIAVFLELPGVILGEAFLSMFGLGPQPPTATWGTIALDGLYFGRVWELFLPTVAITVSVLGANLLADGLDDILDPRRRSDRGRRPMRRPLLAPRRR